MPELDSDVRSAWIVSIQSLVWTTVSATTAIALGVTSGSVVLVAFGAIGFLDALGSAALTYHFHHALRHAELSDELERLAHRIVSLGLVVVGAGAVGGGAIRLAGGVGSRSSAVGTGLAAVSLVILAVLSRRKQAIARRLSSAALLGDGHLSAVGAAQAAVTLAGGLTARIGWHWADPLAAMAVGAVAMSVAGGMWRAERISLTTGPAPAGKLLVRWAFLALVAVALVDAALGDRLVLIGFLVIGPCVAAASVRPRPTAAAGLTAVGLAIVLGYSDQIWWTTEHLVWVGSVAVVAAATSTAVALVAPRSRLVRGHDPAGPPGRR